MHSETERYQVRDAAGERKPIEILSGGDYGRLKSFTPSCRLFFLATNLATNLWWLFRLEGVKKLTKCTHTVTVTNTMTL
jgi:hypothetical protein